MVNHGLSTGGLFAVVGMIYERYHTRKIADLGGLARRTPRLGLLHGLPGAVEHRPAGPERLRGRVPHPLGDVPAGLGRRAARVGLAIPPDRRAGGSSAWSWAPGTCSAWSSGCSSGRCESLWHIPWHSRPRLCRARLSRKRPSGTCRRGNSRPGPLVVLVFWIGLFPGTFLDRMGPTLDWLTQPAIERLERRESGIASRAKPKRRSSFIIHHFPIPRAD